ncbi:response regulator transcription factor [Rhizobium sp. RAF36]|uniref:response regulator transcription factor n=1 Tax=Rhizobium sp. RAF36 TaxID=3233055 RepID=UPI003F97790D
MDGQDVLDCPTISIVDDDVSIRVSLMDMFDSLSIPAAPYESGDDFLTRADLDAAGCILLDIHMPGMSGLDLQRHLADSGNMQPIVFMTGCATVAMSVQAMKLGAFDFLLKPLESGTVVATADKAIQLNAERRAAASEKAALMSAVRNLTGREREVMRHVVMGRLNKHIAHDLGVSEMMIKIHRGRMMKKMQVASLADLVKKLDLASKTFDVYQ